MAFTRRDFLLGSGLGVASSGVFLKTSWAGVADAPGIRVGACVVDLDQAAAAGLAGVEVNVGPPGDRLRIADLEHRRELKGAMGATGLPICSLMMALYNECPLASDPRAPAWLDQSIDAAADLGAKVILIAFFGNGDLLDGQGQVKEADVDAVVKRLQAAAPRAQAAGVVLGIENYLDAGQNLEILERVNHPAVQVYYDVFNTGVTRGHDVPAEIRKLGSRIAQFHFKNDRKFLDAGPLDYRAISQAMRDINYQGWVILETSSPTGDAVADARRNGEYARSLFMS